MTGQSETSNGRSTVKNIKKWTTGVSFLSRVSGNRFLTSSKYPGIYNRCSYHLISSCSEILFLVIKVNSGVIQPEVIKIILN